MCAHYPEAIAIAIKRELGRGLVAHESCVFPWFNRDLNSAKLPNLGSAWPNISPTWTPRLA